VPGERVEGLPDDLVPVRVELRRFDEEHRVAGAAYSVFDHVAREQADRHGPLTADHLRALAEQGRVMWLFDGLDEVADPQRRRDMAARIAGLLDTYKNCRAVATSRVAGVDVARPILEGAGFQTYAIQDFTAEQRDRFLDAWHELIFRSDARTGEQRRARMAAAIEAAPSLQELCKSPLLCSLLAYLHREESLPQRRHRLYQKVLERMAEHWDANKGLPPRPSAERFELEDKLAFLRALAWKMQSEARTAGNAIGRSELEDFTADFCEKRWGQPRDAARRRGEALIYQLQARNGVLTYLGADTYGFAHRAFLEYLAASEAVERFRRRQWEFEDLTHVFVAHWQDATWEETLLLTCGLVQEDGEAGSARVVRLLQGIGEGRLAEVYESLNDYIAFCIKALGELPQLEKGVPGDFAQAVNDLLRIQIRLDVLYASKWSQAFRRCSGRWPNIQAFIEATAALTTAQATDLSSAVVSWLLYHCWVAAGGRALRAHLITEALSKGSLESNASHICTEAALHGPWSKREASAIIEACLDRGDQYRLDVANSIVSARGTHWAPGDRPIELLRELAHKSSFERLQAQSALTLILVGCHQKEARQILFQKLQSQDEETAEEAASFFAAHEHREDALKILAQIAKHSGTAFIRLVEIGITWPSAAVLVRDTLDSIRREEDPHVLLNIAAHAMQRGLRFFTDDEILDRWRKLKTHDEKLLRVLEFRTRSGTELVLRALVEMLTQGVPSARSIEFIVRDLTPQPNSNLLYEVWRRLLDLDDFNVTIPLAARVLFLSLSGPIRARAEHIRNESLNNVKDESIRFHAAHTFRRNYPPAQKVLEQLAENAKNEHVRWNAARFTGNLPSLNDLARRTADDDLRDRIRLDLDLYGEINSLLQVGKLRRARVRFEGRDVGVLEELTKVGNGTRFRYNPDYDGPPIAPNMPLGQTYEDTEALLPFFANLLPEGALYEQTARRLGKKRNDRFGVLLSVGADTMGAIEILPLDPA
jgi:HipA-like protein